MRIVQLSIENVKRIQAAEISPDGALVVVGGKNGAGKTSVLDSIAYALGGKGLCPSKPIKEGAEKGVVKVDLGEMVVERTFTAKGSYLTVKSGDGFVATSPQAILDGLVGKLTFDPLAFATMSSKDHVATLKDLTGLDFSELEEKRERLYTERHDASRAFKEKKAQLAGMPEQEAPDELVSVTGLMDELDKREGVNRLNDQKRAEVTTLREQAAFCKRECSQAEAIVADLEQRLAEAREALTEKSTEYDKLIERGKALAGKVKKLVDADIEEIRAKIEQADAVNEAVRSNRARTQLQQEVETLTKTVDGLSDQITAIDSEKASQISSANLPIEGLAFDEDGVTFNGIPFDQISQAEKLRVSIAMGLAMNPKLRVMLIRDGSLLDEGNLALVSKMAEENDAQIWLERVGDGAEVSVLIEDGHVGVKEVQRV